MPCFRPRIALLGLAGPGENEPAVHRIAARCGAPPVREVPTETELSGEAMSFANQVAVITGASSGIGWALAKVLAAEGCRVGLMARRKEKLLVLADEIARAGGTASVAAADVGDRSETVAAIQDLGAQLGPIDLLIANAGVGMPTLVEPFNVADQEKMFRVNVLGMIYAIEAVLPEMVRRRRGH